jgi:hypothetical protein
LVKHLGSRPFPTTPRSRRERACSKTGCTRRFQCFSDFNE